VTALRAFVTKARRNCAAVNRSFVHRVRNHVLYAARTADHRVTMADLTDRRPVSEAGNGPAELGPVQRDCICLMRAPDGPHIADCNARFKAKFFGAWRAERFLFYGR
jgi:hypothetical protein